MQTYKVIRDSALFPVIKTCFLNILVYFNIVSLFLIWTSSVQDNEEFPKQRLCSLYFFSLLHVNWKRR